MARPSVDEIVATIQRTSLPTVFVEGADDMLIFNRIEQILGPLRASFFPCGDKNTLIEVFRRRTEFPAVPTCFLADRDMWFFVGVPNDLAELLLTTGYSIENDLYSDSETERILDQTEQGKHSEMIRNLCRWFAFEVDKFLKTGQCRTDPKLARLIPLPGLTCCPRYMSDLGFYDPPEALFVRIVDDYKLALRGKLLFEIVVRFTHERNRAGGKYAYNNLIELSIVHGCKGPLSSKLIAQIRERLGIPDDVEPELPLPT